MKQKLSKYITAILWVVIATIGRLVPHLPNVTPLTSLCVLTGRYYSVKISCLMMLVSLCNKCKHFLEFLHEVLYILLKSAECTIFQAEP